MTDPIAIRKQIRVILSALPRERRAPEEFLKRELDRFFPEPVTVQEMREGIEWNHARGYVEFFRNGDQERDEWVLTERGRTKEGLA